MEENILTEVVVTAKKDWPFGEKENRNTHKYAISKILGCQQDTGENCPISLSIKLTNPTKEEISDTINSVKSKLENVISAVNLCYDSIG